MDSDILHPVRILAFLTKARELVLHGHPSLDCALKRARAATRPLPAADAAHLEALLHQERRALAEKPVPFALDAAAGQRRHLPWSDSGGLSRAQALLLLDETSARVSSMRGASLGPLFGRARG